MHMFKIVIRYMHVFESDKGWWYPLYFPPPPHSQVHGSLIKTLELCSCGKERKINNGILKSIVAWGVCVCVCVLFLSLVDFVLSIFLLFEKILYKTRWFSNEMSRLISR